MSPSASPTEECLNNTTGSYVIRSSPSDVHHRAGCPDYDLHPCDRCFSECCCNFFSFVGKLFCINVNQSSRIKILWLWVISISVTAGILTNLVTFGPETKIISPTDMRIVDKKVSTTFCESLSLESEWTTFSAYLLPQKPSIVFNKLSRFEVKRNKYLEQGEFKYWNFYLLSGSQVTIKSCSTLALELYILRGADNLNKWMENKYCDSCFVQKVAINRTCESKVTFNFQMDVTDEYYFIFVNSLNVRGTWLTLQILLERTLYDVSDAKVTCIQSISCSFNLDVVTDEVVVYQISNDDQIFDFDDITIQTKCNGRTWFYLVVFLLFPFSVGITCCSVIYFTCRQPSESLDLSRRSTLDGRMIETYFTERSPLLRGQMRYPPPPPQFAVAPPKYEDAIRGDNPAPPSYDEAVG